MGSSSKKGCQRWLNRWQLSELQAWALEQRQSNQIELVGPRAPSGSWKEGACQCAIKASILWERYFRTCQGDNHPDQKTPLVCRKIARNSRMSHDCQTSNEEFPKSWHSLDALKCLVAGRGAPRASRASSQLLWCERKCEWAGDYVSDMKNRFALLYRKSHCE